MAFAFKVITLGWDMLINRQLHWNKGHGNRKAHRHVVGTKEGCLPSIAGTFGKNLVQEM